MQQSIWRTKVADFQNSHFCSLGEVASNSWGVVRINWNDARPVPCSVSVGSHYYNHVLVSIWFGSKAPKEPHHYLDPAPTPTNQNSQEVLKFHLERENILRLWGHCLQNTREGLFSLGNGALSHESFFRFCVGDLGFLQKLSAVTHYWLVWTEAQKPDPVLFPKSHEPFCPRHSRNTLSISLNNVTKRQSHHWKWPCGN